MATSFHHFITIALNSTISILSNKIQFIDEIAD